MREKTWHPENGQMIARHLLWQGEETGQHAEIITCGQCGCDFAGRMSRASPFLSAGWHARSGGKADTPRLSVAPDRLALSAVYRHAAGLAVRYTECALRRLCAASWGVGPPGSNAVRSGREWWQNSSLAPQATGAPCWRHGTRASQMKRTEKTSRSGQRGTICPPRFPFPEQTSCATSYLSAPVFWPSQHPLLRPPLILTNALLFRLALLHI